MRVAIRKKEDMSCIRSNGQPWSILSATALPDTCPCNKNIVNEEVMLFYHCTYLPPLPVSSPPLPPPPLPSPLLLFPIDNFY